MEFVKKSSSVIEVKIPEGDVIRITDKASGDVLWEKNLAPKAEWITRKLSDYWNLSHLTSGSTIRCLNIDNYNLSEAARKERIDIRIGYVNTNNSVGSSTFTDEGCLLKNSDNTWGPRISGVPSNAGRHEAKYIEPSRALAISNDGAMTLFYTGSSSYSGYWISDTRKQRNGGTGIQNAIKIQSPISEQYTRIIYSPERKEYLVTGMNGAFTIPETLSGQSTQSKYSDKSIQGACWCSRDNLYYGALYNQTNVFKKRCIAYSPDGYSWTEVEVFPIGIEALAVVDMSKAGKLCALASNKAAISTDGQEWTLKDVPFTSIAGYAYSPEYNLLCVVDNSAKVYLTKNLEYWQEVEAPANVKFKDFFHCADGIFAGAAYQSDRFYILTTQHAFNNRQNGL